MWKYVSRRIKDTFERSANHFDFRGTTGVTNSPTNFTDNNKSKRGAPQCNWFCARKCWNSFSNNSNTNSRRWNFEEINRTWLGAITWSSALVFGWYASQLINLKHKYRGQSKEKCYINNLVEHLHPYIPHVNKSALISQSKSKVERVIESLAPTVFLLSNDHDKKHGTASTSGGSGTPDSSTEELSSVLSSIENRLGLAAIEHGQHQDGLNLLRSAARRNHAPAMYNLGLCYEMGLGVKIDEKMAMELYRSAAALEHPGALYNLGVYYGQGRGGLNQDTIMATRLLRLAAVQGQKDAIDALKNLEIDDEPPPIQKEVETWSSSQFAQNENITPLYSTLFVQDTNVFQMQNCEATVY